MVDVMGQSNPAHDVPAVQQAVDAGGTVVLHGTFSFEGVNLPAPDTPETRVILVGKAVEIRGENATILGGGSLADGGFQASFLVTAPDAHVTFERIRFVQPHNAAIRVRQAGALRIQACEIDGVVPTALGPVNGGLGIDLRGGGPFGAVAIVDNRLRIGGSDKDATGGIAIAGTATRVEITGNRINETTAHGMNVQNVGGPARIERNIVVTGPIGRGGEPGSFVNALRVLGPGSYRVVRNELDCGFPNAAVVRIAATTGAEVRQNEILASIAANEIPGDESAGIQVRGSAVDNQVLQNRVRGRGRVALSVVGSEFPLDKPTGTDGNPRGTTFTGNNIQQFDSTVASVEIGQGVVNTKIVGGSGTIIDNGTGTVVQGNFQPVTVPASGNG
jgi:hypothetical protein